MADNTTLNAGTGGDVIATDDLTSLNGGAVSGVKAQRVKVGFGSDASFRDVDASNGLPVVNATAASFQATIQGGKTNNSAAPGATNAGTLPGLANAAVPSWTEGNQIALSTDLAGALRVTGRPPVVTGAYRMTVTTAGYAALAAGANLVSFRYGAAGLCVVTRVRCYVTTSTAATAAGRIDRALFIVRGFTVSDSGGTASVLTGNAGKLRTSHASMGVADIRVSSGAALTAGTGTQDAAPIGVIAKHGTATEPIGLTLPAPGLDADLFAYNAGQNYPIVLAQNEGLRVVIPTAMPTSINQISAVTFEWYEVASGNF